MVIFHSYSSHYHFPMVFHYYLTTLQECCGVEFQQLLIKSAAKELGNAEDLVTLGEIYLLLET